MPTILRIGPYRFYFYSHEPNEPAHMHVDRDQSTAKIWISPVALARSRGFRPKEINAILDLVETHSANFQEAWDDYFGTAD